MNATLLELLPLMIAAAVMPTRIIMVLVVLRRSGGLIVASALVAGMASVRLAQGVVFGLVLDNADQAGGGNDPRTIVSVVILVIGILMLITALRLALKEPDPDAPPPKWMSTLDGLSAGRAFGFGALLLAIAAKHWIFTLGALSIVVDAGLGQPGSTVAFLLFVLGAEFLLVLPLIAVALAPAQTAPAIEAMASWLESNNDRIMVVVSGGFGAYFLWKALSNLL